MATPTDAREGYTVQLAAYLEGLRGELRLYTNDPDITPALVAADLVEVAYDGYAPVLLSRWTDPAIQGGVAVTQHDPVLFEWDGGATPAPVRGWFVTDAVDGGLLWVWRVPGPAFPLGPGHPQLLVALGLSFPGCGLM